MNATNSENGEAIVSIDSCVINGMSGSVTVTTFLMLGPTFIIQRLKLNKSSLSHSKRLYVPGRDIETLPYNLRVWFKRNGHELCQIRFKAYQRYLLKMSGNLRLIYSENGDHQQIKLVNTFDN